MLGRHSNELLTRLERVADIGAAEIRKMELLHWYDQDRLTVNIWRDIQQKWEEILELIEEKKQIPLLVGDADGVWTFIWGEGLAASQASWFQDVKSFAKNKTESHEEAA